MNRFYKALCFIGGVCALNTAMAACSGGESTASANTGGASSTGTGVNPVTGSGGCGCGATTTVDVADFVKLPEKSTDPTWFAIVKLPGRTVESLLGTMAYGVPSPTTSDNVIDQLGAEYVAVNVAYLDGAVAVPAGVSGGAGKFDPNFVSVRFVIPAAP